ncbi:hypothetical protein [Algoriphagus aquimarinus]|uniref:Uncharacterized protein n=1 Tax=Algoriphagus aquimarinus TaxID=237018 RepID=A0A5C7A9E2_9BACT|nr:hypothetical protein [Algoriphagus aquimarinus]TXE03730.1 hypothetical protein ESV85_19790 [Algoriphagus aquimarinus]
MKAILQHKSRRRSFLITVSLILFVIFIVRIYVIPYHFFSNKSEGLVYFISILDKISTSLIVSIFIAWFLFKIEVPEEVTKLEIIEPNRLKELFVRARLDTNFWFFSGGTGRYTRAVTIPEITKISKDLNESRNFKILLMNPKDKNLCNKYANYRNSLKSAKNTIWTTNYVQNEIIATICSAYIHKSLNPLLEINLFLKSTFSTMRIDLSQSNCIVTKEDKKDLALLMPNNTYLYKTYKEEVFHQSKQCDQLDMNGYIENVIFGSIKAKDIEEICMHFQFHVINPDYEKIAKILNDNINPYG